MRIQTISHLRVVLSKNRLLYGSKSRLYTVSDQRFVIDFGAVITFVWNAALILDPRTSTLNLAAVVGQI